MIKKIVIIFLAILFVLASLMWFEHMHDADFYYVLYYWIILTLVVICVWLYRISSGVILSTAFFITVVSAVVGLVSVTGFGESVMRLGLIFWLVGVVKLLME